VLDRDAADLLSCVDAIQPLKSDVCGDDLIIIVNRRSFLKSVMIAMKKADFSFWKPLRVVFSGDDAENEGGPRREFFRFVYITFHDLSV